MAFDYDSFLMAAASVTILAYMVALFGLSSKTQRLRDKRRDAADKAISRGLAKGAIQDLNDILDLLDGLNSGESRTSNEQAARALRRVLASTISDEVSEATLPSWLPNVKELLRKLDEKAPFDGLEEAERAALRDVLFAIEAGEKNRALGKVSELAGLLKGRRDEMERLRSTNKWSMFLNLVGLILTIAFGIAAWK